ncbi:60S ribosome subunit biogenesis protein NIP7 [Nematocida homosporus]|uniref:60S ribosome subunit biogenesis protein NIP7 n=1 Tax=Nematocida homosporus TaxID=1912981 RepID=UPI00221E9E7E|nr:60S ribosome subunit biogenesis protein NIP7 [Nematocida homosporus]KAI5187944.1 60S ribosome subunit biogenesis protein NIP7 [Nematocida homosporus]
MRELTSLELEKVEKKVKQYIGSNFGSFLNPMFRLVLNNQKVYYVSTDLLKRAQLVARDNLVCLGTCLGRFTKSGHFRIKITALSILWNYCLNRVRVKPTAEMSVLYGNHVQRAHLVGIPTEVKKNAGVVLCTVHDIPLGFGIMTKSGTEIVSGDRTAVVVVRHGDAGEYLRNEADLM